MLFVCVVVMQFQIIPPSFATPVTDTDKERLFEALFPRVDGPADTRHFERCPEKPSVFNIAEKCNQELEFVDF